MSRFLPRLSLFPMLLILGLFLSAGSCESDLKDDDDATNEGVDNPQPEPATTPSSTPPPGGAPG